MISYSEGRPARLGVDGLPPAPERLASLPWRPNAAVERLPVEREQVQINHAVVEAETLLVWGAEDEF